MPRLNALLMGMIVLVCAGLLVKQTFFQETLSAVLVTAEGVVTVDRLGDIRTGETPERVRRGEIVRTGEDGFAQVRVGFGNEIWMDANTDVRIENLRPGELAVTVLRGRVFVDTHTDRPDAMPGHQPLALKTLRTTVTLPYGRLALTHYDFLETLALAPLETAITIAPRDSEAFETSASGELHETPPVAWTETTFDPTTGARAGFYERVGVTTSP